MIKTKQSVTIVMSTLLVALCVGCGSTKLARNEVHAPNSNEENNVTIDSTRVDIVDWSNRTLGSSAQPEWLQTLVLYGNARQFKNMFGVSDDRVVKPSIFEGKSEVQALNLALAEFSWSLSAELCQSIEGYLVAGTGTKRQDQMNALRNYAIRVHADIVGAREETRFWQKYNTVDKKTNTTETKYVYYVIYSLDSRTWETIVKKYMTDLIGELVENKVDESFIAEVGACYSKIVSDADKKDREKAERELAYIRSKQAEEKNSQDESKKFESSEDAKVKASQSARELVYASYLK